MTSLATQLRAFRDLGERSIKQAAARALNKAATATRREIPRVLKEEDLGLPPAVIRDAVTITKANVAETLSNMSVTLAVSRKPIRLYLYGARARAMRSAKGPRVGVTVKVKGPRKALKGAFIATVGAGHVGVFVRRGNDRLPIKELPGPTIAGVFGPADGTLSRRVLAYARAQFVKEFQSELQKRIAKASSSS